MLAGRFGSEAERAKERSDRTSLREAVQAALQDKIAAERAAREETNAQMREEVEAKERARAEREKLEAEEAAAALEEERARAEEERQLAAEDAAAACGGRGGGVAEEARILLSAFVMVELEKKNNFEKSGACDAGLLSIHEKALMPPCRLPLAGSTISPILGKARGFLIPSRNQRGMSEARERAGTGHEHDAAVRAGLRGQRRRRGGLGLRRRRGVAEQDGGAGPAPATTMTLTRGPSATRRKR